MGLHESLKVPTGTVATDGQKDMLLYVRPYYYGVCSHHLTRATTPTKPGSFDRIIGIAQERPFVTLLIRTILHHQVAGVG